MLIFKEKFELLINLYNFFKGDLEIELERNVLERADLQDTLEKMDNAVQTLEQEKKSLQEDLKKVYRNDLIPLKTIKIQ